MAVGGFSATNFLRYNAAIVTAIPLTMACWARIGSTGSEQVIMGAFNSASGDALNLFRLGFLSSGVVQAMAADAGARDGASSTIAIPNTTAFHHIACTFDSGTTIAAYLNGGNKGTFSPRRTPSGINRFSIGRQDCSTAVDRLFTGDVGEAAVWNVALTDAEIAQLATGMWPMLMRPQSIVAYFPLKDATFPSLNLKSNTAVLSQQGTVTAKVHPRIIMPHRKKVHKL